MDSEPLPCPGACNSHQAGMVLSTRPCSLSAVAHRYHLFFPNKAARGPAAVQSRDTLHFVSAHGCPWKHLRVFTR